jgi:hypothetical protein
MTVVECLQGRNGIRLTSDGTGLHMQYIDGVWHVWRNEEIGPRTLYNGTNEHLAVAILTGRAAFGVNEHPEATSSPCLRVSAVKIK